MQCLPVLHHGFDAIGFNRAGEPFIGRLDTFDDWHRHVVFGKVGVNVQHLAGFGFGFFLGGVGRMAFLPQELGGTQEEAGTHFPADHVGPLVHQDGQVAVRLDPILIGVPDDGFRSGAHNQFFFQFGGGVHAYALAVFVGFEAVVGHHGAFLGKAFHMVGFAAEEGFGDEKREISVLMPGFLEHLV